MLYNKMMSHDGKIVMTTLYADYECASVRSSVVHKFFCSQQAEDARCRFFDDDGKLVSEIRLPSANIGSMGLPVLSDGKHVVTPSVLKNGTTCYSLDDGHAVWTSPIEKIIDAFVYGDKIYCYRMSSAGGLVCISAKTGAVLKEFVKFDCNKQHLEIFRFDERRLLIHSMGFIYLFDMETDELLLSKIRFDVQSELFGLIAVEHSNDFCGHKDVALRFQDVSKTGADPFGLVRTVKSFKPTEILRGAKPSGMRERLSASRSVREREYDKLFERND